MELYKKEKINPLAGCLPIAIQIPVFFSLYKVLFVTIEMRHAPFFGWIKDLSAPDPTNLFNLCGLIPVDPTVSGAEIERRTARIVQQVAATVKIPVSVKLAPYFSSTSHMAAELVRAGARGLVLFNRFYAPDIDLTTLEVTRSLPLSTAAELPLSLVWIALLSRRVACSLAASRGVETHVEVVKYLLAGADVVMTASALLRNGVQHVGTMRRGLESWLGENGFASVDAIRGLKDATHVEHVDALLRAQYVAALTDYLPATIVR